MQTINDLASEIAGAPEDERLRIVRQFLMDVDSASAHTPAALANRGVFVTRASLVNV